MRRAGTRGSSLLLASCAMCLGVGCSLLDDPGTLELPGLEDASTRDVADDTPPVHDPVDDAPDRRDLPAPDTSQGDSDDDGPDDAPDSADDPCIGACGDTDDDTWVLDVTDEEVVAPPSARTAGELLVDLDALDPSAGGATWTNAGSLGDFTEIGDPFGGNVHGVRGIYFDGTTAAYEGPPSAPTIEGADDRTIEVWVLNPAVERGEETVVSWSQRGGPMGTFMAMNYGYSTLWGAGSHWSNDIGWGTCGVPAEDTWHHQVYTYDGATARVYVDGGECNTLDLGLDTHAGYPLLLAVQREGWGLNFGLAGSLWLAKVRIHSGALSGEDVAFNFELERASFGR